MIYRLFKWLFGYCKITLKGSPSAAATLFLRKQINVNHLMPTENGVFFEVMLYERKKTLKLLKDYSFEVTDCKACGLPARLSRYRKRWGLILGALLCAAIIWASSLFLWQIDVVGNETLSDAEVLSLLEDHGFSVGSYLPSLSVKELCNDCLLSEPRLAYLSVNVIGTHCEV